MPLIRHDDPCLLVTMRRESSAFLKRYRPTQRIAGVPCWASFCGPADRSVLVMETGIGKENVLRAIDWILTNPIIDAVAYEPRFVVLAGFAGALVDNLKVGDVICAAEIVDTAGSSWRIDPERMEPTERLVTVDRLIAKPEDKRQLASISGAIIVDMESAYVAARCEAAGVPFACVRVISDEVTTAISPALTTLLTGGNVAIWRLVLAVARRPLLLPELLRLARDTKIASTRLADVLAEMLGR
ncbi:MAG: hypothetical protein EXS16_11680 [Gemmataceae bacterium]|nr:hypothetical protein [Gemmataceae bacterium]